MQQEAFTISPYEKEATRATVCISYQLLTAIEQKKNITNDSKFQHHLLLLELHGIRF